MQRKPFHIFLMHAAFLLVLIGVVGGTNELYARSFHHVGNWLLGDFGSGLSVRFQWGAADAQRVSADTRMLGRRAGDLDYAWRAIYSAQRRGFWPTATLLALTLAAPLSRGRRAAAAVAGILLFNAFFLLEVAGMAAVLFRATGSVPGAATASWHHFVPVAEALFNSPITNYTMVFLIWAGVAQPAQGIEFESAARAVRRLLGTGTGPPPGGGGAPRADSEDGSDA